MADRAALLAIGCFTIAGLCAAAFVYWSSPLFLALAVINTGLALVNLVTYARS